MSAFFLGLDPGFASLGWATFLYSEDLSRLLDVNAGVIRTKKSHKKLRVAASSDDHRRGREIARALHGRCALRPLAIAAEAMSFPRNAGSAYKVGRAWGVVDCLAMIFDVPVFEATPQNLKVKVAGSASASKDEVEWGVDEAVDMLGLPGSMKAALAAVPASLRNHAYDAGGAILATLERPEVRMLVRRVG